MAEEVILPSLGQTTNELTIISWFKKDGDTVQKGDVLLEVETDKAVVPVEAFVEGILKDIRYYEGDLVEVGSVLALIMSAEEASAMGKTSDNVKASTIKQDAGAASTPSSTLQAKQKPVSGRSDLAATLAGLAGAAGDYILASPLAKQMAREQDVDLHAVQGSGRDGVIKADDVAAFVQNQIAKPMSSISTSIGSKTKLTKMRKTIADRLSYSKQTIPHFYVTVHVDVSDMVRLREDLKHQMGVDVSYNSFLFRASALALGKFPEVNSSLVDDYIITHPDVHIGLAVEVEDGLRVPVIRGVGQKTVWELTGMLKETADRARQGRLSAAESSGGTFTISSLGTFGIDEFSAIVNPPEAAILAVGRISKRAFVYGDEVRSGMGLTLTLSVDHRIIDGAVAGRFLNTVREELEHPHRLLVPSDIQSFNTKR